MKIRPEDTRSDALARTRPALHRGRSEPHADRPQQTGHFPLGQSGRHAARLAAGRRHAGRRVIDAQFDYPLEAALETDVTSKSNSFIGPGITFKVSNNNLFRGGEVLAVKLNGSYEWQTGNKNSGGRSSRLNSYELGLNANLNIPRLLLPAFA